eukprot:7219736-Pyramimonas_sp.AAC.1
MGPGTIRDVARAWGRGGRRLAMSELAGQMFRPGRSRCHWLAGRLGPRSLAAALGPRLSSRRGRWVGAWWDRSVGCGKGSKRFADEGQVV